MRVDRAPYLAKFLGLKKRSCAVLWIYRFRIHKKIICPTAHEGSLFLYAAFYVNKPIDIVI